MTFVQPFSWNWTTRPFEHWRRFRRADLQQSASRRLSEAWGICTTTTTQHKAEETPKGHEIYLRGEITSAQAFEVSEPLHLLPLSTKMIKNIDGFSFFFFETNKTGWRNANYTEYHIYCSASQVTRDRNSFVSSHAKILTSDPPSGRLGKAALYTHNKASGACRLG